MPRLIIAALLVVLASCDATHPITRTALVGVWEKSVPIAENESIPAPCLPDQSACVPHPAHDQVSYEVELALHADERYDIVELATFYADDALPTDPPDIHGREYAGHYAVQGDTLIFEGDFQAPPLRFVVRGKRLVMKPASYPEPTGEPQIYEIPRECRYGPANCGGTFERVSDSQ